MPREAWPSWAEVAERFELAGEVAVAGLGLVAAGPGLSSEDYVKLSRRGEGLARYVHRDLREMRLELPPLLL